MAKKLYLVSDTRLTLRNSNGEITGYRDDIIKILALNERISLAVAGNLDLVKFITQRIKSEIRPNSSASFVKYVLKVKADGMIRDYVNGTGTVIGNAAFIIAGYNLGRKQKIESSRLGDVMSAGVIGRGENILVNQGVDTEIIKALDGAIHKKKGLNKGDYIEIGCPQSELIGFDVEIRPDGFEKNITTYDCYEYAVFHPGQKIRKVELPNEVISELDFRAHDDKNKTGEQIFFEDTGMLSGFVVNSAKKHELESVGGNILVFFQTQYGGVIAPGDMIQVGVGGAIKVGRMYVEDDILKYKFSDGRSGEYKNFEQIEILGSAGSL